MDLPPNHHLARLADTIGLSEHSTHEVIDNAAQLPLISFSGWFLSGKDTVALAVYRALGVRHRQLSFADAIKAELDEVIGVLRVADSYQEAAETITDSMAIPFHQGLELCTLVTGTSLEQARHELQVLDAHQRTPGVRRGLQYLGSEIRRAQDPMYWIRQAQRAAVLELLDGKAFVFTDVRLPAEVVGLQHLGATVVRLEISRQTQLTRLRERDGLQADPAALYHETEVALNDYDGFDAVIDNEQPLEAVVADILALTGASVPTD